MITEVPKWCRVGFYIDAKDSFNEWCAAEVKEIGKNQVTVTFNEWAPKWESTFPMKSPKIAPFRKMSKGYTGSRARTARNQQFQKESLANCHEKVKKLVNESLFCEDAFFTTQFYRGKLFFYIEHLLSLSPSSEYFSAIYEFLGEVVALILKYFSQAHQLFGFFYLGQGGEMYLEDNNVALAFVWFELIEMLKKLTCLEMRSPELYCHIDQILESRNYTLTTSKRTKWANDFLDKFLTGSGFDFLMDLLSNEEEKSRIPFVILNHLPLCEIIEQLDTTKSSQFSQKFYQNVLKRVEIISDSELKDLKHDEVLASFRKISKYRGLDLNGCIESSKMSFFLKMLKSVYLEKRIKGLIEINSTVESAESRVSIYDPSLKQEVEDLRTWIIQENILDLLVKDRPHMELIKRSSVIFKFLARYLFITQEQLSDLWHSLENKHESYRRAAYETIVELVPLLEESQNDFLYEEFLKVDRQLYDESFLALVKDFTVKAVNKSMKFGNYSKTYGLSMFKPMILDSSPSEFHGLAIKNLISIEKETANPVIKSELLETVKSLISENDSILQALSLFLKLIQGHLIDEHYNQIEEIFALAGLIIENLKNYLKNNQKGNFCVEVKKNIKCRLSFLSHIAERVDSGLSQENLKDLWTMFRDKSLQAKLMFFEWLCRSKGKSFIHSRSLSFIFQDLLLNDLMFPSKCESIYEFKCFSFYFIEFNRVNNLLEVTDDRNIRYRKSFKVKGLKKLINIYLNTDDSKVLDNTGRLFFNVLNKFDPEILSDAEDIIQVQVKYLLDLINKNKTDQKLILKILTLFQVLFDKNDDESEFNSHIYVKRPESREHQQVKINQFKTLRHIRKEVAKNFNLDLEKVELCIGDNRFSAKDDDYEIMNLRQHWLDLDLLSDHEIYEFQPFAAIENNEELPKLLFELISDAEKIYTDLAWKLLAFLPTCKSLKVSISGLKTSLDEVIDRSSTYRLIYALQIVLKKSNNLVWLNSFKQIDGVRTVIEVFLDREIKNHVKLAALKESVLLQILANTLQNIENPLLLASGLFSSFQQVAEAISEGEELDSDIKCLKCLKKLFKKVNKSDPQAIKNYLQQNSIQKIIKFSLIDSNNQSFTEYSCEIIIKIACLGKSLEYLLRDCNDLLQIAIQEASKSSKFWELLTFALSESTDFLEYKSLAFGLLNQVALRPSEHNSAHKDEILSGILQVLQVLWKKYQIDTDESTVKLILENCLCEIPETKKNSFFDPPKCKNFHTRTNGFKLLEEICKKDSFVLNQVTSILDQFHQDPSWRSSRKPDWSISPITKDKSHTGYVGLKNLGCTCYMNSILQQLFMISTFRESILRLPTSPSEESLLYQLQYIFSGLKSSDKQYINPKNFTKSFKDAEGREINVIEQMDVDEFFASFMDKLETLLKATEFGDLVKMHFGGVQVTQVIGKECPHRSETFEPFLSISVEVKNKRSLVEGLESYVAEEVLQGEDAYQCDSCEAKVKAIRRVCVNHLPNILIVALRRFEFDFDTMTREKLNDYFEFPFELDMEPFTQEGLEKEKKFPKEYYIYRLRGIVIHSGSAENGHYYSYIHSENRWIEFNDIWVSLVNPHNIAKDCYGGEEKMNYHPYYKTTFREKIGNAYMLIYERSCTFLIRQPGHDLLSVDLKTRYPGTTEDLKEVKSQNKKYWRSKIIFAPEYITFISDLSRNSYTSKKFLSKFFLTILIRSKDKKEEIFEIYSRIENDLKEDSAFANWFLDMISVEQVTRELFLHNPLYMMRKLLVSICRVALKSCTNDFRILFFKNFIQNLKYARKKYTRFFAQYLELLKFCIIELLIQGAKFDYVCLIISYLTGKNLWVLEANPHAHNDIHLGYDQVPLPERLKEENSSSDTKGSSIAHLVDLLYQLKDLISEESLHGLSQPWLVQMLIQEADNRLSAISTGRVFTLITKASPLLIPEIIAKLVDCLKTGESTYKVKISRILTHFLIFQDETFDQKIIFFIDTFFAYVKNCKLFSEIEFIIVFLYKLCCKHVKISEILLQKPELLTHLEKWVRSNLQVLHPSKSEFFFGDEGFKTNSMKNLQSKIEMIKKKSCHLPCDSDEELPENLLKVGVKVDFYLDGSWMKGVIKARAGDVALVSYKSQDEEHHEFKDLKSEEVAQCFTKSKTS